MATSSWTLNGHRVGLTHGFWSGAASISVDDKLVFRRPCPPCFIDYGFAHRFDIDGTPVAIRVHTNGVAFWHEFLSGDDALPIAEANVLPPERLLEGLGIILGIVAVGAILIGSLGAAYFFFNR